MLLWAMPHERRWLVSHYMGMVHVVLSVTTVALLGKEAVLGNRADVASAQPALGGERGVIAHAATFRETRTCQGCEPGVQSSVEVYHRVLRGCAFAQSLHLFATVPSYGGLSACGRFLRFRTK